MNQTVGRSHSPWPLSRAPPPSLTTAFLEQSAYVMDLTSDCVESYRAAVIAINDFVAFSFEDVSTVSSSPHGFAKKTRECALAVQIAFEAFVGAVAADRRRRSGGHTLSNAKPNSGNGPLGFALNFPWHTKDTDISQLKSSSSPTGTAVVERDYAPFTYREEEASQERRGQRARSGASMSTLGEQETSPPVNEGKAMPVVSQNASLLLPMTAFPSPPAVPRSSPPALSSRDGERTTDHHSVRQNQSTNQIGTVNWRRSLPFSSRGGGGGGGGGSESLPNFLTCLASTAALSFDNLARLTEADEGVLFVVEGPQTEESDNQQSSPVVTPQSPQQDAQLTAQALCLFGSQRSPSWINISLETGIVGAVLRTGVALNIAPENPTHEAGYTLCFPIFKSRESTETIGAVVLERKRGRFSSPSHPSLVSSSEPFGPFNANDEALVVGFCNLMGHQLRGYGVPTGKLSTLLQFDTYEMFKRSAVPHLAQAYRALRDERASGGGELALSSITTYKTVSDSLSARHSTPQQERGQSSRDGARVSPRLPRLSERRALPTSASRVSVEAEARAAIREAGSMSTKSKSVTNINADGFTRDHGNGNATTSRGGSQGGMARMIAPPKHGNRGSENTALKFRTVSSTNVPNVSSISAPFSGTLGTSAGHTAKLRYLLNSQTQSRPSMQLVFRTQHHGHFLKSRPRPLQGTLTLASQNVVDVATYIHTVEESWRRSVDDVRALTMNETEKSDGSRALRIQLKECKERNSRLEAVANSYKDRYEALRRDLTAVCEVPLDDVDENDDRDANSY